MHLSRHLLLSFFLVLSAQASTLAIGEISLNGDIPTPGFQQVIVSNLTGPLLCNAIDPSCDELILTQWMLHIDYLDPDSALHVATFAWSTPADDISSDSGGGYGGPATNPWNLDFSITAGTITQIAFSANIVDRPDLQLAALFIPSPGFQFLDSTALYANVNSDAVPASAPEPSTLALFTLALLALWQFRRLPAHHLPLRALRSPNFRQK